MPVVEAATVGKLLAGTIGAGAIGISIVTLPFLSPAFRKHCLPFIPATDQQIQNVFEAVKRVESVGRAVDLGSGDGRIVHELAKHGYQCDGIELNLWLVWYSRFQSRRMGLRTAKFYRKDMWKANLALYDTIVIFGTESLMPSLEQKLYSEMHQGSSVIACRFPLSKLTPVFECGHGIDTVWLYKLGL